MTEKKFFFEVDQKCKCGVQIKIRQYNQIKLCFECKKIKIIEDQKAKLKAETLTEREVRLLKYKKYEQKNKIKIYAKQKQYREKNNLIIKERRKKYYNSNKTVYRNKQLQKLYGITLEQFNHILKIQNNECFTCKIKLDDTIKKGSKKPNLDHDHEINKVRAILCSSCNISMGLAKENINTLSNMVIYLKEHKNDEQLERMGIKGKARQLEEFNRSSESIQKEIERVNIEIKRSQSKIDKWIKVLKEKARRYDLMRFALRKTENKV